MKLVAKVSLLLLALVAVPLAVALAQLVPKAIGDAREVEKRSDVLAAREVERLTTRPLESARGTAEAVAGILGRAAKGDIKDDDAIESVRAILASGSVHAIRFEVPPRVSTVIRPQGATVDVPESTPEMQKTAADVGFVFHAIDPQHGLVVVPIRGGAVPGFVTARVELGDLSAAVGAAVTASFQGELTSANTAVLVVDESRRVILAYGMAGLAPGADATAHPVFHALEGTPRGELSLGTSFVDRGVAMSARVMVSPDGLVVAVWRPESIAFAGVKDVRRAAWLSALAAAFLALGLGALAAQALTRPILELATQAKLLGERKWKELRLGTKRRDEIGDLFRSFEGTARELEQSEREIVRQTQLRGDLGRFLNRALVDAIVDGKHELSLGGRRATISVLFADVVAFTPLAESRPAEQVVALLNELFSLLTEVVFRHGGTVDKFVGDCLMAVWGAPVEDADHARHALAAAEDMMRLLETANEGWVEKYGTEVRLGIGINAGEAIVGNIGSNKRMEYTVVGDVVNVAARLEALARPNEVLVAAAARELAGDAFDFVLLGERKLTGRTQSTEVYALDLG